MEDLEKELKQFQAWLEAGLKAEKENISLKKDGYYPGWSIDEFFGRRDVFESALTFGKSLRLFK